MIRLLLVDDEPSLRRGLRMRLALEPDITPVGEAGDGGTALQMVVLLQPDIVLMDVEMRGMDGITAANAVRVIAPDTAVVLLTLREDATTRARALAAGAAAVVSKRRGTEELLEAIRQAATAHEEPQRARLDQEEA